MMVFLFIPVFSENNIYFSIENINLHFEFEIFKNPSILKKNQNAKESNKKKHICIYKIKLFYVPSTTFFNYSIYT